jgi:hypothetical protein
MRAQVALAALLVPAFVLAAPPPPTPAPTPAPAGAGIKITAGHAARRAPAVANVVPVPAASPDPGLTVYRIETARQGVLYAADHPMQSGDLVSFHEHPSGTLVSLRRAEIQRVVVEHLVLGARGPRPGDAIDIGVTGSGSASRSASAGGAAAAAAGPGLGSRKDGTALLNPDREYQPDVDSKQVPGLNMGYPNSPNDYREGRTLGYPAAPAVQSAPGEPPKMAEPKPN